MKQKIKLVHVHLQKRVFLPLIHMLRLELTLDINHQALSSLEVGPEIPPQLGLISFFSHIEKPLLHQEVLVLEWVREIETVIRQLAR